MKKVIALLLIAATLLIGCEIHYVWDILSEEDSDIFMPERAERMDEKANLEGRSEIKFLIFTDAHIGRENVDSFVTSRIPELEAFIRANHDEIDFILNLGDTVDSGNLENQDFQTFLDFIDEMEIPMLAILGNHERHSSYGRSDWDALYAEHGIYGTLGAYTFGPLTIYALDSSRRLYGRTQLEALEAGLAAGTHKYKLLITHTDNTSGTSLDQTLFILGTADIAERNRLIRLMSEYDAPLMLYGHTHIGNTPVIHSSRAIEYNLASLHTRDVFFEGKGNYYMATLYIDTGILVIVEYSSKTGEETNTYSFQM